MTTVDRETAEELRVGPAESAISADAGWPSPRLATIEAAGHPAPRRDSDFSTSEANRAKGSVSEPFRPEREDLRIQLERALAAGKLLQDRVFALSRELARAAERDRSADLARELASEGERLASTQGQLEAASAQIEALNQELADFRCARDAAEQALGRHRASVSWRITKPLRTLARCVRLLRSAVDRTS